MTIGTALQRPRLRWFCLTIRNSNLSVNARKTPEASMSTKEHLHVFRIQRVFVLLIAAAVLALTGTALAQTVPQIGLKFGINGLAGLQNTNVGALQPADQAGAPGYAQTNWNVLGFRGDNVLGTTNPVFNVLDSSGANSGITIQWDGAGVWSVANGGTPADQFFPDGNLMKATRIPTATAMSPLPTACPMVFLAKTITISR